MQCAKTKCAMYKVGVQCREVHILRKSSNTKVCNVGRCAMYEGVQSNRFYCTLQYYLNYFFTYYINFIKYLITQIHLTVQARDRIFNKFRVSCFSCI